MNLRSLVGGEDGDGAVRAATCLAVEAGTDDIALGIRKLEVTSWEGRWCTVALLEGAPRERSSPVIAIPRHGAYVGAICQEQHGHVQVAAFGSARAGVLCGRGVVESGNVERRAREAPVQDGGDGGGRGGEDGNNSEEAHDGKRGWIEWMG
jgi:hypothetical protein